VTATILEKYAETPMSHRDRSRLLFGTVRSEVRILSPRPIKSTYTISYGRRHRRPSFRCVQFVSGTISEQDRNAGRFGGVCKNRPKFGDCGIGPLREQDLLWSGTVWSGAALISNKDGGTAPRCVLIIYGAVNADSIMQLITRPPPGRSFLGKHSQGYCQVNC
jgi:hypothetical protein